MPRASISLDPRLSAIAEMCGKCGSFADIGSDHGRLGAYMLQTDACENVQLTDISAESLMKARKLIGLLGLSSSTRFLVGDGAEALVSDPDVAVIAGMGGDTISGIIRRGRERLKDSLVIMQPNVGAPELRQCLCESGFMITDENIVRDGRRLYVIIAARRGDMQLDDLQLNVGPVLVQKRPEALNDYAQFRLRVARKALAGAAKAGGGEALRREIALWEEVASWYPQE